MLDIYWNILTMHVLINVKFPNNISKWQMGFNSAFKGLISSFVPVGLRIRPLSVHVSACKKFRPHWTHLGEKFVRDFYYVLWRKIQVCTKIRGKFTLTNMYIRVIGLYYGDRPCSLRGAHLGRRNTRRYESM
jgi:hypothetical protein